MVDVFLGEDKLTLKQFKNRLVNDAKNDFQPTINKINIFRNFIVLIYILFNILIIIYTWQIYNNDININENILSTSIILINIIFPIIYCIILIFGKTSGFINIFNLSNQLTSESKTIFIWFVLLFMIIYQIILLIVGSIGIHYLNNLKNNNIIDNNTKNIMLTLYILSISNLIIMFVIFIINRYIYK